jgi:hypothetical protein
MTETEKARNIIKEWTTGEYAPDGRPLKRILEIDDLDNLAIDLVKKLNIDDVSKNEAVCNCENEYWKEDESGDWYCTIHDKQA